MADDSIPPPPEGSTPIVPDGMPPPPEGSTPISDDPESFLSAAGRTVARGAIEGAVALPELALDVVPAAANLVNAGIDKVTGKPVQMAPLPSEQLQRDIDKLIPPSKKSGAGIAETAISLLTPGGDISGLARGAEELPRLFSIGPREALQMRIAGNAIPESERIVQEGVSAGFQYPPSELPHAPVGKLVEGAFGKARSDEEASIHNLDRVQQLVNVQLHLPPEVETAAHLDKLEDAALDTYRQVERIPKFTPTPGYYADLSTAGQRGAQAEIEFPADIPPSVFRQRMKMAGVDLKGMNNKQLTALMDDLKTGNADSLAERAKALNAQFSGKGALQKIIELRRDARGLFKSGNPRDALVAQTKTDISKALEKELGVQAEKSKNPQLMTEFQNARTELARINAVRDAIVGGKVSARKLAQQWKNGTGTQFDGNLKMIAENADRHPRVFQDIQSKGEQGPYTVHDLWLMMLGMGAGGVEEGLHHGVYGYGITAYSAVRPLVRKALTSKPLQKLMTRPASKRPVEKFVKRQIPQAAAVTAESLGTQPDLGDNTP